MNPPYDQYVFDPRLNRFFRRDYSSRVGRIGIRTDECYDQKPFLSNGVLLNRRLEFEEEEFRDRIHANSFRTMNETGWKHLIESSGENVQGIFVSSDEMVISALSHTLIQRPITRPLILNENEYTRRTVMDTWLNIQMAVGQSSDRKSIYCTSNDGDSETQLSIFNTVDNKRIEETLSSSAVYDVDYKDDRCLLVDENGCKIKKLEVTDHDWSSVGLGKRFIRAKFMDNTKTIVALTGHQVNYYDLRQSERRSIRFHTFQKFFGPLKNVLQTYSPVKIIVQFEDGKADILDLRYSNKIYEENLFQRTFSNLDSPLITQIRTDCSGKMAAYCNNSEIVIRDVHLYRGAYACKYPESTVFQADVSPIGCALTEDCLFTAIDGNVFGQTF